MTAATAVALWRAPFGTADPIAARFDPRTTLAEMVAAMRFLPPDFARRGDIVVGGHVVDRARWRSVRLKPGARATFHRAPGGGGGSGDSRKRGILGLVIAVATVLTAGLVATAGIPALGVAAGSTAARVIAGGITLIGSLAAQAISAPPTARTPDREDAKGPASVSGNVLRPGGFLPRVVGTRRIFPPLAAQPLVHRIDDDEIAEAVFALEGPHRLEDIRIGDTPIEEAEGVEIETREGWPSDRPLDTVERIAHTESLNLEIAGHKVQEDDGFRLENQSDPNASRPEWRRVASRGEADEIHLHLLMPEGLFEPSLPDRVLELPIRLRMRAAGASGDWIDLPEIHLQSGNARSLRPTVAIKWADPPVDGGAIPRSQGFTAAYKHVPAQAAPEAGGWTAHPMFSSGSGGDGLYFGGQVASGVRRVALSENVAAFHIDENVAPRGAYEIESKRGAVFASSLFTKSDYRYSGSVRDFFSYTIEAGVAKIVGDRHKQSDRLYLARAISLIHRHPIRPDADGEGRAGSGLALIAVKAKNRELSRLSVLASGYVRDWDGSGWNAWTTTSLPAPHFHDVLRGKHGGEPLPADLLDNRALIDWRAANIAGNHRCDLIAEGAPMPELLTKIAGCGYARPAQSEVWGVIRDYDRSGEDPTQIFSAANSSGLSMARAFARLPDALRCAFRDGSEDDRDRQVLVWREGREGAAAPKIEDVRYQGLKVEADVIRRARHDLRQAEKRAAVFTWQAPAEAIRCRRGDLVGINHDSIDKRHGSARVDDIEVEDGRIVAAIADAELELWNEPDFFATADLLAAADFFAVGRKSSIEIRRSDGLFSGHDIAGPTGTRRRIELAEPPAAETGDDGGLPIRRGNLLIAGETAKVKKRLIVAGVEFDRNLIATISAVAEAPEIFATTQGER